MTLYPFNALGYEDQLNAVWDQGTYLLNRPIGRSLLCLYALSNFFVEIRLIRKTSELSACRSFKNPIHLEPYLHLIPLKNPWADNNV